MGTLGYVGKGILAVGGALSVPFSLASTVYDLYEGRKTNRRISTIEEEITSLNQFTKSILQKCRTRENLAISNSEILKLAEDIFKSQQLERYRFDEQFPQIIEGVSRGDRQSIEGLLDRQRQGEIVILPNTFSPELLNVFQDSSMNAKIVFADRDIFDKDRINVAGEYNEKVVLYQLPRRELEIIAKTLHIAKKDSNSRCLNLDDGSLLIDGNGCLESVVKSASQIVQSKSPVYQPVRLTKLERFLWPTVTGFIEGVVFSSLFITYNSDIVNPGL